MKNKVKKLNELIEIVQNLKEQGKKIVFTNGCFDILHIGHIRYLKKAKSLGDILIVGVNSDKSVKRIKSEKRPIISQSDRVEMLSEFLFIDFIIIFEQETPLTIIKKILPDVLVKGGDWQIKDIVGNDVVKAIGGKVLSIPLTKGKSTSNIIEKIIQSL